MTRVLKSYFLAAARLPPPLFGKDPMVIRSINIEHEIPSPLTYSVEVTIELESGERRWCFFCTPESLDRFGDFLPNSAIRIHACAAHMIVLSNVTQETITAAIEELQRTGELLNATRPVDGTSSPQSVWVFNVQGQFSQVACLLLGRRLRHGSGITISREH